jgi:hypothetical protein
MIDQDFENLVILSEWVKSVRSLIQIRIKKNLSGSMSIHSTSIFMDPNVAKHLSLLHDKYVIRIHKYFKVVFPVYGFRLTIFRSFGEPPVIT